MRPRAGREIRRFRPPSEPTSDVPLPASEVQARAALDVAWRAGTIYNTQCYTGFERL